MADLNLNVFDASGITENIPKKFLSRVYHVDYINGIAGNDGYSWATAKKRISDISAPTSRDLIKIAKTPDPVSMGVTVAFTDKSANATLGSALTLAIDNCDNAWTPSLNVTHAQENTNYKEGVSSRVFTIATAFTTGLVAYRALGSSIDFSAYSKITFWIRPSIAIVANTYQISLCSDVAGVTQVDNFTIAYPMVAGRFYPLTIARDGGGSLGSAIQSVALYALLDPGVGTVVLDHITACNDFSLNSLVGKSNTDDDLSYETWWSVKSIVGTGIIFGANANVGSASATPYFGKTETVTGYYRNPVVVDQHLATVQSTYYLQTVNGSGTNNLDHIRIEGGWNTGTDIRDGYTFYDGLNGWGIAWYCTSKSYIKISKVGAVRFYYGLFFNGTSAQILDQIHCVNNDMFGINASTGGQQNDDDMVDWERMIGYLRRIRISQCGLGSSSTQMLPNPVRNVWEDILVYSCGQNYGFGGSSNFQGGIVRKMKIRGVAYPLVGNTYTNFSYLFEDCWFESQVSGYTSLSSSNGAYSGSVFKNCTFVVVPTTSNFIGYSSGSFFADFYNCDFLGASQGANFVNVNTNFPCVIRLYDCYTNITNFNLIGQGASKNSRVESFNHNRLGTTYIRATKGGTVIKNTVEYKSASPCAEIHKVVMTGECPVECDFVAPMDKDTGRTLKIWLKRSNSWNTGNYQEVGMRGKTICIGARFGNVWIVGPTDITEQVDFGVYKQFTVTVPSSLCKDFGVIKLTVAIDCYGGSNDVAGVNRVYCDDFEWS